MRTPSLTRRVPVARSTEKAMNRTAPLAHRTIRIEALSTAALAALLIGFAGSAARADNFISVGYAEAAPGDRSVPVIVTGTNDVAVHGYSIALTYPADVLQLAGMTTVGTHVNELAPDFVSGQVDNVLGVGSLGVIFTFSETPTLKELAPVAAGGSPRILARLDFNVKSTAVGGSYPLRLVDGIGTPASFNRFSDRGTSIVPRLEDGVFLVSGGNVTTLEKKYLFPGLAATPTFRAWIQHPDPLAGFQIGFTFSKSVLQLVDATYAGTALGRILGDLNKIEAWNWDVDTGHSASLARGSVASLFDYRPPFDENQVLPPCTSGPKCQDVVVLKFQLQADADQISQYFDLDLQDTGRPGYVDNRFIVGDRSLDPRLVDGKIYFSEGGLRGRVLDAMSGQPVGGVKVATDPDPDLHSATTGADGRFTLTALPAGKYILLLSRTGYYAARHVTRSDDSAFEVRGNGATEDAGDLGIYKIPTGGPTGKFIRGRINDDGKVDLSDAIYLLSHLFQGAPEPECLLAADANDDNRMDLSDCIYILNHLFLGGPEPSAPYGPAGTPCADDPTPGSSLTCVNPRC